MTTFPLLSLVTFLPLAGVLLIMTLRGEVEHVARNARWIALWTALITFGLSIFLWTGFDPGDPGFQFEERLPWLQGLNISYHLGVDGISMLFVLLSTFLTPICILASWQAVKLRVKEYMVAFLVLETMMVGMFAALDLLVFYVFFEGVLIPMFLIIGVWGRATARLCRLQVFPLYAHRLGADAAGGDRALLCGWYDRYSGAAENHRAGQSAILAVAGFLRLLRGQGADVAGAYLAAGCTCGSAYRRVR